ncbi:MAG TPA: extensin family protein [Afipia sp.]
MTRGVRLYLVGSFVLVSLAGCGRGFFQAEREPWRAEAEAACLKSGAVKESADLVRIAPISGPGMCGAEFPLKVAALGESNSSLGYVDDMRPPNAVGNAQPRWPVSQPQQPSYAQPSQPPYSQPPASSSYPQANYQNTSPHAPMSLNAPAVAPPPDDEDDAAYNAPASQRYPNATPPSRAPYASQLPASSPPVYSQPRLGTGSPVSSFGPVVLKPTATLACPIVSALDSWLSEAVQPAAQRWFGARVVEIKQISAYSCRGMNGNSNAHISEHAFGNALDVAGFTLADGRYISVQNGWKGLPEEQGFLRDVQGAACQRFTTVLAPGANIYHYNHIHVDLMRRASGRIICQPAAVSGEEVAARAAPRGYAGRDQRDNGITGSISLAGRKRAQSINGILSKQDADTIEDESRVRDRD